MEGKSDFEKYSWFTHNFTCIGLQTSFETCFKTYFLSKFEGKFMHYSPCIFMHRVKTQFAKTLPNSIISLTFGLSVIREWLVEHIYTLIITELGRLIIFSPFLDLETFSLQIFSQSKLENSPHSIAFFFHILVYWV